MPIDPADIRAQEFRVVFRGYDIEEVDAFLDRLEEELAGPTGGAAAGTPAADGGPPTAALRTLVHAERMAEQLLAEATAEATAIRAQARAEAAAVLADARAEAVQVVGAAGRPRPEVGELVARGRRLRTELDRLDQAERHCRDELRSWLDQHERLLDPPPPPAPGAAGDPSARTRGDTTTVRRVSTTLPFTAVR